MIISHEDTWQHVGEYLRHFQKLFLMAGLDVSQMKSEIESTFSYRKATQTHNTFIQSLQALPLISQLKSLLELLTGNTNAALITQINFSKQCIIVSQLRSLVEASLMNNPKQAVSIFHF